MHRSHESVTVGDVGALAGRLFEIVRSLDGQNVAIEGEDLTFDVHLPDVGRLQLRLGGSFESRSYERSANLTISYGERPFDEAVSRALATVVARVKAIDSDPLTGVAAAFSAASMDVVRDFQDAHSHDATESEAPIASVTADAPRADSSPELPSDEQLRASALNVIFLDLCAAISPAKVDGLSPLHWGFWPIDEAGPVACPDDYDPPLAFSEHLLGFVPAGVTRVLDVGCGLGANAKLLAARGVRVTAVSPVPHHCEVITKAGLAGVAVRCARFEDLTPDQSYDLLLFSESVGHFWLDDQFFEHCTKFLGPSGFILMADDLPDDRAQKIETQTRFRVIRSSDISANVAPTLRQWERPLPAFIAYHRALMATLELYSPRLATEIRSVVDDLDNSELRLLFSGQKLLPVSKGRYMIYLLQRLEIDAKDLVPPT